ncbi:MAG: translation initiation factor IF-2 [Candidatus Andersenbacteria bacterium]
MNITELAKRTNLSKDELRDLFRKLRLPVKPNAKKIEKKWVERIEQYLAEQHKQQVKAAERAKPEATRVIKIPARVTVKAFAERLDLSVSEVITELLKNGIVANLNESIDFETAAIISEDLGVKVEKSEETEQRSTKLSPKQLRELLVEKDERQLKPRPPIVVITGHVDHGKTTLLDALREANVAAGEAGGITQHIGAYQVVKKGKKITFLDTPGHEAFSAMRQRGTSVTDIAVLVVAANDGVKPQTIEAINFAKAAGIPIVVAINKIDLPDADPTRVKKELSEVGVLTEEWGGDTVAVEISAKQHKNLDKLLEMLLLVADVQELRANPHRPAIGTVLESHVDKQEGPVATVLVLAGTLNVNDQISVGSTSGTIRKLSDFKGDKVERALPADPVQVFGLAQAPEAGDVLMVEISKRVAKEKVKQLKELDKLRKMSQSSADRAAEQDESVLKLPVIIKADVQGSLEAVVETLRSVGTKEVVAAFVRTGVGDVTESDVLTAQATHAVVLGFNVKTAPVAKRIAEKEHVEVEEYKVIYDLVEATKKRMAALLPTEHIRTDLGTLRLLAIFRTGKGEMIVGGKITSGVAVRGMHVEVLRNDEIIGKGKVTDLQQAKKRAEEVKTGIEAGVTFAGPIKLRVGDILKFYKEEERARTL